jgi:hypothetical protein
MYVIVNNAIFLYISPNSVLGRKGSLIEFKYNYMITHEAYHAIPKLKIKFNGNLKENVIVAGNEEYLWSTGTSDLFGFSRLNLAFCS